MLLIDFRLNKSLLKWPPQVQGAGGVDEDKNPRSTPPVEKAMAQVGTSVVTKPRLQISGELRSSSYSKKIKARKTAIPPLHIRYQSVEEVEHVKANAAKAGLSINSYIRASTLEKLYTPPRDPALVEELRQVKRQLTGIGINLNQLMHSVNAGTGHVDSVLDYIDVIREPVLDSLKPLRKTLSRRTDGPLP